MWQPRDLKPGFLSPEVYSSFFLPDINREHDAFWLTKRNFPTKKWAEEKERNIQKYSHKILEPPTATHRVTKVNK